MDLCIHKPSLSLSLAVFFTALGLDRDRGPYSKGPPQCPFIDSADPGSSPTLLSGPPASGQGQAVSLFSTCPGQWQIFWNLGNSVSNIPSLVKVSG